MEWDDIIKVYENGSDVEKCVANHLKDVRGYLTMIQEIQYTKKDIQRLAKTYHNRNPEFYQRRIEFLEDDY